MNPNIDLTLVGNVNKGDGIGNHLPMFLNCYKDKFSVNAFQLQPTSHNFLSKDLLKILIKPFDGWGKVSIFTYILGTNDKNIPFHQNIQSPIKIAYTMLESDQIPDLWVKILNSYYDFAVVPDKWLEPVYKNSGVKIPIFTLPLGIEIEEFLTQPIKNQPNELFTFGLSAGWWERKQHTKVFDAFVSKFKDNPKFKLKLHGRFGGGKEKILNHIKQNPCSNVEILDGVLLPQDYLQFMSSLDCYVFCSKSEGFSITPREALALGLPCILSNNTAHKTICQSGTVLPVKSEIKVPAYYEVFQKNIGNQFDCHIDDIVNAMQEVVDNYSEYLQRAKVGREWVKQYLWNNLQSYYNQLVKPDNLILGNSNSITANSFKTSDKKLYSKLKSLHS